MSNFINFLSDDAKQHPIFIHLWCNHFDCCATRHSCCCTRYQFTVTLRPPVRIHLNWLSLGIRIEFRCRPESFRG